jgi:polyphosphate kinase
MGKRKTRDPSLFINRELSWLEFNRRVLEEAQSPATPLLERLKFLSIVSSNLDEFFMVRVAGLRRQGESAKVQESPDGMTVEEQLQAISRRCHEMVEEQYRCLHEEVLPALASQGVVWHRVADLSPEQHEWVDEYFHKQVFPVLTPLAIDPSHPFPHLRNLSLNLAIALRPPKRAEKTLYLAVVQVPGVLDRVVQLPGEGFHFVLLEEVIADQIQELFQGLKPVGCYPFRVTRDSDLNIDEEDAEDLLETMEEELRKREWQDCVRLETSPDCPQFILEQLCAALKLSEREVYKVRGPLNLRDFMEVYKAPGWDDLRYPPYVPPEGPEAQANGDLFAVIREGDILLHHPFDSFSTVVHFVEQAADDPDVLAIKQTLYRTSGDSPIVQALMRAAQNRKSVTVLVELKARFDEENNINWARGLEEAGVHVVYGMVGLKTHCKLLLVVRREQDRLRRYVHLGTGNYHPATARLYTDLGLLTCQLPFGQDVSRLFNILTGYSEIPQWRKLSVAPLQLRERILKLIEREASLSTPERPGRIIAKMNALVDVDTIEALYRASQAGVRVDLIVRGICCLRPGVPGVSENIRVRSIIGRYLEHSRIFYFENGGQPEVFLSSADWMPRNFDGRVETMFPVEDPALKQRLIDEILGLALQDNVQARELQPDGSYRRITPKEGEKPINSQEMLMQRAHQRVFSRSRPLSVDFILQARRGPAEDN